MTRRTTNVLTHAPQPLNGAKPQTRPLRVSVLAELPVQYLAPLFARLSRESTIDLTVLYLSAVGTTHSAATLSQFDRRVVWDIDLLSGYKSKFVPNPVEANPSRRWSLLNPALIREIRPARCDVLVSFGWAFPANWLAVMLARLWHIPFLLLTDTDVRDQGLSRHPTMRRLVLEWLCRHAAGALYTGTFNRDFYIRHGVVPSKLWFSPWCVDNDRFQAARREEGRAELGLHEDVCYFVTVGTLIERKRPLLAVEAVAALQQEGKSVGLILAGSGYMEAELKERIRELGVKHVLFLGFVNQARLPKIYAAADVLLLASRRDARATVVNEAMAAGRPVVVSSGAGVWGPGDLVKHGREGLIFDADNFAELVAACRTITDAGLRHRMGEAAWERVQEWSYETAAVGWRQAMAAVERFVHA